MSYLERAIADGHAKLTGEGKQQAVPAPDGGASVSRAALALGKFGDVNQLHNVVNHTGRYADPGWCPNHNRHRSPNQPQPAITSKSKIGIRTRPDPEEQVRAGFWAVMFAGAHASGVWFSASRRKFRPTNISPPEIPEIMCAKSSGATPKLARGTRALPKPEEYRFHKSDPNNDLQPVRQTVLITRSRNVNRTIVSDRFQFDVFLSHSAKGQTVMRDEKCTTAYAKHSVLLRRLELEALAALAKNANAKIYIGFDKRVVAEAANNEG